MTWPIIFIYLILYECFFFLNKLQSAGYRGTSVQSFTTFFFEVTQFHNLTRSGVRSMSTSSSVSAPEMMWSYRCLYYYHHYFGVYYVVGCFNLLLCNTKDSTWPRRWKRSRQIDKWSGQHMLHASCITRYGWAILATHGMTWPRTSLPSPLCHTGAVTG